MGGWLLASICMYEMFPSYLGQSGGSLSSANKRCMEADGHLTI